MNGPATPNRRNQLIVLGVLAAIILVVAIVVSQSGSDDESSAPSGEAGSDSAKVEEQLDGIVQSGTFLGDPNAPVTVTEFVDLQCPFCGQFSREALPQVIDEHVRSGEVLLNLQILSFLGNDSTEAAEVAAAASLQNRMWQFVEVFYLNQGEENSGYVTEDFLAEIADASPGLDGPEALEQAGSPEAQAVLDEAEAQATEFGANSTPTFFISVDGGEPEEMQLSDLTAGAFTEALDAARGG